MTFDIIHIDETDSTNRWLREHVEGHASKRAYDAEHNLLVWADYQSAGRGCGTNTWESERGKNLLFSMLIHPQGLKANAQFRISMAISIAIVNALTTYLSPLSSLLSPLSIKWPNDIYWQDRKLGGILIENRLAGVYVRDSIIGVGLNVNQAQFLSDAPNPVSLCQITGHDHDREALLHSMVERFALDISADDYRARLYRRHGFHPYRDAEGDFEAELITVEDDGHLLLRDSNGRQRRYAFKEVQFILS